MGNRTSKLQSMSDVCLLFIRQIQ